VRLSLQGSWVGCYSAARSNRGFDFDGSVLGGACWVCWTQVGRSKRELGAHLLSQFLVAQLQSLALRRQLLALRLERRALRLERRALRLKLLSSAIGGAGGWVSEPFTCVFNVCGAEQPRTRPSCGRREKATRAKQPAPHLLGLLLPPARRHCLGGKRLRGQSGAGGHRQRAVGAAVRAGRAGLRSVSGHPPNKWPRDPATPNPSPEGKPQTPPRGQLRAARAPFPAPPTPPARPPPRPARRPRAPPPARLYHPDPPPCRGAARRAGLPRWTPWTRPWPGPRPRSS
jgi:hypothetical protein